MLPATAFDVDRQLVHLEIGISADANQKLVDPLMGGVLQFTPLKKLLKEKLNWFDLLS